MQISAFLVVYIADMTPIWNQQQTLNHFSSVLLIAEGDAD